MQEERIQRLETGQRARPNMYLQVLGILDVFPNNSLFFSFLSHIFSYKSASFIITLTFFRQLSRINSRQDSQRLRSKLEELNKASVKRQTLLSTLDSGVSNNCIIDGDACQSGPTINFDEVDPNIKSVEAYRSLQIGLDQIGSDWIRLDQMTQDDSG